MVIAPVVAARRGERDSGCQWPAQIASPTGRRLQFTAGWRNASSYYKALVAESRAVRPLSSYCRDTARAPVESCDAQRHRDFARLAAAQSRARFVAARPAIGFPREALSRRLDSAAPEPPRIRWRFVI